MMKPKYQDGYKFTHHAYTWIYTVCVTSLKNA